MTSLLLLIAIGCKSATDNGEVPSDSRTDSPADSPACEERLWYPDVDQDGYGDDGSPYSACEAPTGHVPEGGDCDDTDAKFYPGAEESCTEPGDTNCDGVESYADADADGYPACTECDDAHAEANPAGMEICDGLDNNCDGLIDQDDPTVWLGSGTLFCPDDDHDGYGDITRAEYACAAPEGFVSDCRDCDDGDAGVSPGAVEVCDGRDNDCDYVPDNGC